MLAAVTAPIAEISAPPQLAGAGDGHVSGRRDRALAFALAAIPVFIAAGFFPLIRLDGQGSHVEATLFGAVKALHGQRMAALALLVLTTTVLLPAGHLAGLTYWLLARRFRALPAARGWLVRLLQISRPWIQIDILLLAALVALAKLASVFALTPGPGLALLLGFLLLQQQAHRLARLPRVHAPRPRADSLNRAAAFLIAAAVLFVPANLLPVMGTRTLRGVDDDTIWSGVQALWRMGSWPLSIVVFVASLVIPALKIGALGGLVIAAARRSPGREQRRRWIYRAVERVGRWSMLDVFVMGLLAALVNSRFAGVHILPGAVAFAAVVVLTMLASASFDPALLGDPGREGRRG